MQHRKLLVRHSTDSVTVGIFDRLHAWCPQTLRRAALGSGVLKGLSVTAGLPFTPGCPVVVHGCVCLPTLTMEGELKVPQNSHVARPWACFGVCM